MTKALNRRAFLATGAIATAAVAVAGARPAGAAGEVAVYRLSADWGYPVGPKNKTRCSCRACFRRAENAYFRTREAALAGRIHPCCVCQPYATTVPGVTTRDLFLGAQGVDRRDPRVAAVFQGITVPSAEPHTGLLGIGSTSPTSPVDEPAADPNPATTFARTGSSLGLARVGAGALGIGAALLAFRNRRPTASPAPATSRPPNKEPS